MTKEEFYNLAECDSGWFKLLDPIYEYIESYNKEHSISEHIEVAQIKEKFGSLRIYLTFETEELRKLIEDAEQKSYHTCERCGSTENVTTKCNRPGGWILTLCDECRNS